MLSFKLWSSDGKIPRFCMIRSVKNTNYLNHVHTQVHNEHKLSGIIKQLHFLRHKFIIWQWGAVYKIHFTWWDFCEWKMRSNARDLSIPLSH